MEETELNTGICGDDISQTIHEIGKENEKASTFSFLKINTLHSYHKAINPVVDQSKEAKQTTQNKSITSIHHDRRRTTSQEAKS